MISIRYDKKNFEKTLKNTINYSLGFLDGAKSGTIVFNTKLAEIAEESLKKYIDVKARANPELLHHVYEWNQVGNPSARLFEINAVASKTNIVITGEFIASRSVSENSNEPFVDKANVMENAISILVKPKSSDVLAFDVNGQQVFTVNSIFIENPGGDRVAGSFGKTVNDFFEVYFTTTVLKQSGIFEQLSFPKEFTENFVNGAKIGRAAGKKAGLDYMNVKGGLL